MSILKWDGQRRHDFTRRTFLVGAIQLGFFAGLGARLHHLQVRKAADYAAQADENRINTLLLIPERGLILDRNGAPLAGNRENFRVMLIPEQADDIAEVLRRLNHLATLDDGVLERVRDSLRRDPGFVSIPVLENLTWRQFAEINLNRPELPGIHCEVGRARHYPHAEAFAHVVGHVAPVSKEDIQGNDDPLLHAPEFRIGRAGIETSFDEHLRGSAGAKHIEINSSGRPVRELARREGRSGAPVQLSLDTAAQLRLAELLAGESAAGVVMNIHNGELLAMVSTPSYDPNRFGTGISKREWQSLTASSDSPFLHRCIEGQYAPGSTFKLVVALAALENDVIEPGERFFCSGKHRLGRRDFHCWKRQGHGSMDMLEAIVRSCDVYFYNLAQRISMEQIAAMARRLGLGQKFDLALPGGKAGLVPSPQWKRSTLGEAWFRGENLITAVGQGYLLATPLQLAVMTARIANGGLAVLPRIIQNTSAAGEASGESESVLPAALRPQAPASAQPLPSLNISRRGLSLVREAMYAVSNDPRGTAYGARILQPSLRLAGKTGTTQVRSISVQERESGVIDNKDLQRHLRDHALFVAYAPASSPRYAACVVVEHGGSGSRAAAPPVRDILRFIQERERGSAA